MTLVTILAVAGAIVVLAPLIIICWHRGAFGCIILKCRCSPREARTPLEFEAYEVNAPPPSPSPSASHPQPTTFSPTTLPPSRAPSSLAPSRSNEHSSLLISEGWTAWDNDGPSPTNHEHHEPSQQSPTPSSSILPSPSILSSPPNLDESSNLQSNAIWAAWSHGRPTNREYHETNQISLNIHDEDFSPHQEERPSAEGQISEGSPYMLGPGDRAYMQTAYDGTDELGMESHPTRDSSSPQRSLSFVESVPCLVSDHGSSDLDIHCDDFKQGVRSSSSEQNRTHSCARPPCPSCSQPRISTFPHAMEASVREPRTPPDPPEDRQWMENVWDGAGRPSTQDAMVPSELIETPLPRISYSDAERNRAGLDTSHLASALAGINSRVDNDVEGKPMSAASTQADLEKSSDDSLTLERDGGDSTKLPFSDLSEASGPHEPPSIPNLRRNASGPWHPPLFTTIFDSENETDEEPHSEKDEEDQRQKQKSQRITRQPENLEDKYQSQASTSSFAVRRGILTPPNTAASSSASSPGRGSNIPNPPERSPEARVPEGPQRVVANRRLSQSNNTSHPIRIPSPGRRISGLAVEAEKLETTTLMKRAVDKKVGSGTATKPDTPPSSKSDTPLSAQEENMGGCHYTPL